MLPSLMIDVAGPAFVMTGFPQNCAIPYLSVLRNGAIFSKTFFFPTLFSFHPSSISSTMSPPQNTLSPTSAPTGTSTNLTTSCSSLLAHSTIPWEGNPASLRSLRLQTTKTFLPSKSSSFTKPWRPLAIILGSSSPTSTSSQKSFSDSSCFQTFLTSPTRMSRAEKGGPSYLAPPSSPPLPPSTSFFPDFPFPDASVDTSPALGSSFSSFFFGTLNSSGTVSRNPLNSSILTSSGTTLVFWRSMAEPNSLASATRVICFVTS
mmetsp:Transcript_13757/g.28122  ORF Transcript_13757/g.28122 Transcript_13757/m.28122 type:complete len:262 (+) Transcript_13757:67-852(+)